MANDRDLPDLPSRDEAQRRQEEIATAESISRRNESMANVLGRRTAGLGSNSAENPNLAQVAEAEREANERLKGLKEQGVFLDPEGTAPTLSDRRGNFAPNPQVANAGGTGIDDSNTVTATGEQAQTFEEAMEGVKVNAVAGVPFGRGGVPIGPDGRPLEIAEPEAGEPVTDLAPSVEQALEAGENLPGGEEGGDASGSDTEQAPARRGGRPRKE